MFSRFSRRASLRFTLPLLGALLFAIGPYSAVANASTPDLNSPLLAAIPDSVLTSMGRMRRPAGMAPWQFSSYIRACEKARVSPFERVMQTIGNAPASAGFHLQDGTAGENGQSYAYCAATDLRTRDLTQRQIYDLQTSLTDASFGGWYRTGPKWVGNNHIHTVFVGYPMKSQLRAQIRDFLADKNGLAGHAKEPFFHATSPQKARLLAVFLKRNKLPS